MALSYQTIQERDLGRGIDARSAENLISEGFVSDLLNGDTLENRVLKRRGTQGFAGNVPVRVFEYTQNGASHPTAPGEITFTLDAGINLLDRRSSPLVVYGRTADAVEGDFLAAADDEYCYSTFSVDVRKDLEDSGSSEVLELDPEDHLLGTSDILVETSMSTSATLLDYQKFIPDAVEIHETGATNPYQVDVTYTLDPDASDSDGVQDKAFVYYYDATPEIGTSYHITDANYINPVSLGGPGIGFDNTEVSAGGSRTFLVDSSTHQLNNLNVVPVVYDVTDPLLRKRIIPLDLFIQQNGDIVIDIANDSTSAITVQIILVAAPGNNVVSGQIGSGDTSTEVTIPVTDSSERFRFVACYNIDSAGDAFLSIPDKITFDELAGTITVRFENDTPDAQSFEVYWLDGFLLANRLRVQGETTPTADVVDERPQLTIWGLDHSEIYGGCTTCREGWTNHIDSYRRSAERRMVTGLGGNIFTAQTGTESPLTHPELLPNLRSRISGADDVVIAPLIWDTPSVGTSILRSRGYVTATEGGSNWLEMDSITYQTSGTYSGSVEFSLIASSLAVYEGDNTPESAGSPIDLIAEGYLTAGSDQITIEGAGFRTFNNTYTIEGAVADVGNSRLLLYATVPGVSDGDCDETEVGGRAGVFTDKITLDSSRFLPGDRLSSGGFSASDSYSVVSGSPTAIHVDGVVARKSLAASLRIIGTRNNRVIPLRNTLDQATVECLVRGDMLSYAPEERLFRVKYINPADDITITDITVSAGVATATIDDVGDTVSTQSIQTGQHIILLDCGDHTGVVEVTAVPTATTFEFAATSTSTFGPSGTGTLVGKTIHVDEDLEWSDALGLTTLVSVPRRWIPVEAPQSAGDLVPNTYIQHFDSEIYIDQSPLRSTMANDNLYFTNGNDEVMKFDGSQIYRAGLFRWQPGLFTSVETGGGIDIPDISIDAADLNTISGAKFFVNNGTSAIFSVGDSIIHDNTSYVIENISSPTGTADDIITVGSTIASGDTAKNISLVTRYTYYFRLNAVDANSNIIASAVTGSEDFQVELAEDSTVHLRMVGMPVWDIYDYDNIEVEIYRTRANQAAPFYKIATIPMSFDNGEGYIDYADTASDDTLNELDPVNSALLGTEIGTQWNEPMRAKYITSSSGRLILGNLSDYPEMDIQLREDGVLGTPDLVGKSFLFRRDNTDSGTDTNMIDRVVYEFVDTAVFTPSGYTSIDPTTLEITSTVATTITAAGQWVYIARNTFASSDFDLDLAGWYQVSAYVDANTFQITYPHTTVPSVHTPARSVYVATDPRDVPVYLGTDGNRGTRFGNTTLSPEFTAMSRLGEAINSTMRVTDTSITSMSSFTPWLIASSGGEFTAGQLVVRQPRIENTSPEVVLPSTYTNFRVAVNGTFRTAGSSAGAVERLYPSRIIQSYQNFPEIFDNVRTLSQADSDSVVDVNLSDGQEITGIIPFFGESVTSAAQKEGILLAFKENSVYVYNTDSRNPQRLETQGLGCTAPYSIAVSREGINFANEAGIYQIDRSMRIQFLGRFVDRIWLESVNRDRLDLVVGHNFAIGKQYKLSVPLSSGGSNTDVLVYDYAEERKAADGSWSRYDSHPATGWANLDQDAFYSSTSGRVFSIRRLGDVTDYRDDDQPIEFRVDLRAMDFGDSAIRKTLANVVTHLRAWAPTSGTEFYTANDLGEEFQQGRNLVVERDIVLDGIGDSANKAIISLRSSVDRRKFTYLQLRYRNATLDEPVEVAGVSFRVAGLSTKGIEEAADVES